MNRLILAVGLTLMSQATIASHLAESLVSNGPSPELGENASLYGWLVGDWDAEVIDYKEDGTKTTRRAEIHFDWVLEGRAIQDVWISPPRSERGDKAALSGPNRYGTTLRIYDRRTGKWRVRWFNPVTLGECALVAERVGKDIVQVGTVDDGTPIRWSFTEITPDSFRWRGEVSRDGGKTWVLQTEFIARRSGAKT